MSYLRAGYQGTVTSTSPVCYSDPGMTNSNMQVTCHLSINACNRCQYLFITIILNKQCTLPALHVCVEYAHHTGPMEDFAGGCCLSCWINAASWTYQIVKILENVIIGHCHALAIGSYWAWGVLTASRLFLVKVFKLHTTQAEPACVPLALFRWLWESLEIEIILFVHLENIIWDVCYLQLISL